MSSGRITLSVEALNKPLSQRERKFMLRTLKAAGYKISGGRKRYMQRNRGKDAFKPKDLPRILKNIDNLTCRMASLISAVTGARREETTEILKENIDFESCTIRLVVTKAGVPQDVYFPRSFTPILKKWIHYARESKYLFPQRQNPEKPISVSTLSIELKKAMERTGLNNVLYIKENGYKALQYGFHSFRKFFCSNLVNSGVEMGIAQKLMRHAKIEQTAGVYAKYSQRKLSEAMEKIDPYKIPEKKTQPEEGRFTEHYLHLFNEYREGKISIDDYHRQKVELKELQGFIKN